MSQQHRRFGSPEFAVRNNSMMYEPPTNNLTAVKPGVELIGLDKNLKGDNYEDNPYHQVEVDVSESDEHSSIYDEFISNPNLIVHPPLEIRALSEPIVKEADSDKFEDLES